MTYAAHPSDLSRYEDKSQTQRHTPEKPSILGRLYQAFQGYRQRAADREIAAFLARSGGRFNDAFERELSNRLATGDWQRRSPLGL